MRPPEIKVLWSDNAWYPLILGEEIPKPLQPLLGTGAILDLSSTKDRFTVTIKDQSQDVDVKASTHSVHGLPFITNNFVRFL